MREILQELNQEAEIVGSMVITPDGIMVSAALGPQYEEDTVAAFASTLLLSLRRGLAPFSKENELATCTLNATEGKIVFLDMKNSYLVVFASTDTNLERRMPAIEKAMHRIMNRRVA